MVWRETTVDSKYSEKPVIEGGFAYFQAQKDVSIAHEFAALTNPVMAKWNGRKVHLRPDWEEVKLGIMEEIVKAKFTQHPELKEKLLNTGDRLLVEGGTDNFWGNKGNSLGKILMKVRMELREKALCFGCRYR